MKRMYGYLVLLAALLLLGGCAGDGEGKVRDDVAVADLAAAADEKIEGSDGLIEPGDGYISGFMKLEPEELGDYVVKISAFSTSINEYGIFKAGSSGEAETLEKTIQGYLDMRRETWMQEYLPEEYPKLKDAGVTRMGSYVFYTILSEEERPAVQEALADLLKG